MLLFSLLHLTLLSHLTLSSLSFILHFSPHLTLLSPSHSSLSFILISSLICFYFSSFFLHLLSPPLLQLALLSSPSYPSISSIFFLSLLLLFIFSFLRYLIMMPISMAIFILQGRHQVSLKRRDISVCPRHWNQWPDLSTQSRRTFSIINLPLLRHLIP